VQVTVSNTGGTPANNVTLTSVKVGSLRPRRCRRT